MAIIGKLVRLARSKQGRRLIDEAQRVVRDPENRERLIQARTRLGRRRS